MALVGPSIKHVRWIVLASLSLGSFLVGVGGGFLLTGVSTLIYMRDSSWPRWTLDAIWAAPEECEPSGACYAIKWLGQQQLVDLALIFGLSFGTFFMLLAVLADPRPAARSAPAFDL